MLSLLYHVQKCHCVIGRYFGKPMKCLIPKQYTTEYGKSRGVALGGGGRDQFAVLTIAGSDCSHKPPEKLSKLTKFVSKIASLF